MFAFSFFPKGDDLEISKIPIEIFLSKHVSTFVVEVRRWKETR